MISVILAAGKGERLKPFTIHTPKVLLKFGDKSLIERIIDILPLDSKIIIIISYLGKNIIKYVNHKYPDKSITYVWQNENCHGTMGALLSAAEFINDNFLVICGDNIYDKDGIKKLLRFVNSFLAVKIDRIDKRTKYPFAKYSLFENSMDKAQVVLDAGAWYSRKKFFDDSAKTHWNQ